MKNWIGWIRHLKHQLQEASAKKIWKYYLYWPYLFCVIYFNCIYHYALRHEKRAVSVVLPRSWNRSFSVGIMVGIQPSFKISFKITFWTHLLKLFERSKNLIKPILQSTFVNFFKRFLNDLKTLIFWGLSPLQFTLSNRIFCFQVGICPACEFIRAFTDF